MTNKPSWEREFGVLFISKENGKGEPKVYCHPDDIKNFISSKLAEQRKELMEKILKIPPMWEEDEHEYLMKEITDLIKQD